MKAHHKAWQRIPALVVLALLVVRWERVPYSEAHAPTISPARSRASITVDASSKLKSYSAAPPFTAPYMPDYTSASAEFAPTAERHGADLDTIVPAQSAYQTAHPADAPCGSPQSDCGEGANNGGVPEYNWTGEIDPEINLLTHATRAPSKYVFLILKTPSFLQSSPGNNISYPTNLTAWSNIAADMWHHLYLKAPAWVSKTYIEIWNEPDGKGISLAQYESLYAAAAKAIKQAAAAFNSTAIVGGYVGAQFNTTWLQGWLSNTADNPYIDFVSWHEYANQHVSGSSDPQTMWTNLVSQYPSYLHNAISTAQSDIATYDSALQQNGGSHPNTIPILITEYNEDANGSPSLEGSPTYEIPYLGLFKQLAFTGGVDGINFFYPGGPDFGCQFVSWGMYLTDCSNQIAPWAWVEYLYLHSVGLQYQGFSVVKSSSSDATQFPLAFKLSDGSLGLVLTNSSTTNSVSESITLSNTGMSGSSTIHDYLVDPAHHLAQQPDLTGSAGSTGSISFSVTVPPSSVSGFTLASGAGTPVHVPTYQFQPFSDTFTSYGGAGATVAPPGRDHYTDDFPTWVSTGQVNPFTAINGTVATPASDGLTFADAGAGSSTTALKVSGPGQAYVRTGSYRVDWTRPPGNQKVAVTFQTDWSNMNPSGQGAISSQLILDRDKGNPTGKPLGSSSYLLLQDATGLLSLKTQAGTLGSYAYVPTAKTLSSWRMVIDASKVEVDRYIGGSWQAVIGPVAHGLPRPPTGMGAGLLYLGLSGPSGSAGSSYWANISVAARGTRASSGQSSAKTSATPTETMSPPPATRPIPLFWDNFQADALGRKPRGWTVAKGTWKVVQDSGTNGTHVVRQTQTVGTSTPRELVAGMRSWRNYTVQAAVQAPASSNSICLGARRQDANDLYLFLLKNGNEWHLGKKVAGTWYSLASGSFSYSAERWYTLRLKVSGTTISAEINGQTLASVTDSSFSSGTVSLRTTTTPSYDNVVVTSR